MCSEKVLNVGGQSPGRVGAILSLCDQVLHQVHEDSVTSKVSASADIARVGADRKAKQNTKNWETFRVDKWAM